MAATVNVLFPNGRRQNVKVTANTRILQVIENVCSKMGWNPNEYNLKHHRSILDPELSIRYANLPNNCKLELVKADRPRTESAVFIALQVESGERLQGEFAPATSLWDILIHWETTNASMTGTLATSSEADDTGKAIHPVCIYLRQEIVGEAWLRATTLKSLGLTSGKAIIRLIHRAVNLSAPPSTKPAKFTPATNIQQSSQSSTPASQEQSTVEARVGDGVKPAEVQKMDTDPETSQTSSQKDSKTMNLQISETTDIQNRSEQQLMQPEFKSLSSDDPDPIDIDTTDARQPTSTGSRNHEGGTGTHPKQTQESPSLQLSSEMEQRANMMGIALAEAILKHRTEQQLAQLKQSWVAQLQSQPQSQPQSPPQSQPNFADFKFPQQPSSQSQPSSSLQQQSSKPLEPCERQPLVFSLDLVTGDPSDTSQDLPDEFFEVTVDDVRRMMAGQQLHKSSDDNPLLQTKAMREASALKKAQQYSKVAVRIHFPNRYVLQGFFRPLETVKALKDFIQGHLQDPKISFYLYTTPPRYVLKDDALTLFKAKLFPAAVVHFGSEVTSEHYLQSDLLSEVTSFTKAKEEAITVVRSTSRDEPCGASSSGCNRIGQLGLSNGASTSKTSTQGKKDGSSKRQASGEAAANSEKIPKWFKIGKR